MFYTTVTVNLAIIKGGGETAVGREMIEMSQCTPNPVCSLQLLKNLNWNYAPLHMGNKCWFIVKCHQIRMPFSETRNCGECPPVSLLHYSESQGSPSLSQI